MPTMSKRRTGFTLVEIMIALVALAAIVAIAVPAYSSTVERGRATEAKAALDAVYGAQKLYFIRNGSFWGGSTVLATINSSLSTDLSLRYYDFTDFRSLGANSYTATLRRNAVGRSGAGTKTFTLTYTDGDQEPTRTEGGAF